MTTEELQMTDLCLKSQLHDEGRKAGVGMGEPVCAEEGKSRKVKKPKRILHFSDGILEEYSTDEEEEKPEPDPLALVDPKALTWGPWMYYWMLYSGSSALAACDYVGESLANFLGITSPKYQYEIDEYQRSLEEEKAEKEEEDAEMAGWRSPVSESDEKEAQVVPASPVQEPPSSSPGLKQNLQQGVNDTSKDVVLGASVPSVTVTSETNNTVLVSDTTNEQTSSLPTPAQNSANWDRF